MKKVINNFNNIKFNKQYNNAAPYAIANEQYQIIENENYS